MKIEFSEKLQKCLAWVAQTGYSGIEHISEEIESQTGLELYCDQPYYNAYVWRKSDKQKEAEGVETLKD